MRFQKHPFEEPEPIQMAPLIDIVFIVLVLFMTTSVYGALESELDVTLPTADSAVQAERTRGEIYINLMKDGSIVLNDKTITIDELQGVLDRVAEYFPGGAVIIRGDKDAVLGQAVAVLNACRKADIQSVSFAAMSEEPDGGH